MPRVAGSSVCIGKVRFCSGVFCLAGDDVYNRLALEFDMELEDTWLFDEFFAEFSKRPDNAQLLHRMQALNSQGTISPEEWEAASASLSNFDPLSSFQLCIAS